MKNLKAFLFILFFVNLFKIHSQNQNSKKEKFLLQNKLNTPVVA